MTQAAPSGPTNVAGKWSFAVSASSVLSALAASACCLGPLVFALLGVAGGGLLVKMAPYRPYFMVATFALLSAGFYLTYRKPKQVRTMGPECDCPAPRANRVGEIMLWVATVLVVGFLVFPYLAPVLFK